jgi:hypothetical protein
MSTQTQGNGQSLMVQGRIVWTAGDLFTGKIKTNMQTRQPLLDQQGNQITEYGFGLAINKVDLRTNQHSEMYVKLYQALYSEALTLFPSGQLPRDFAMKFKDGDTEVDQEGKPYNTREGYAGHIVLACTTRIPIKFFVYEGGNNILVNTGIKCGDYVNVQVNIKAHPAVGTAKAGLYVNPMYVQLIQPGKEIVNTPSGDQVFGAAAPTYSGQVVPPAAPQMPGMGMPATPGYQPAPAAPAYAPPAAPQMPGMGVPPAAPAPVAPNYGVLPPGYQPAPTAPAYAPPAAPQMPPMGNQPYVPPAMSVPTPSSPIPVTPGYVPPAYPSNGFPPR